MQLLNESEPLFFRLRCDALDDALSILFDVGRQCFFICLFICLDLLFEGGRQRIRIRIFWDRFLLNHFSEVIPQFFIGIRQLIDRILQLGNLPQYLGVLLARIALFSALPVLEKIIKHDHIGLLADIRCHFIHPLEHEDERFAKPSIRFARP
ncbi:hypothetical protein [Thioalkalivibrio sp. HK1]|uniref:hypothetical protein n=1 Tax=Thioalkalivibrio sp. HK1 TaxID=1469245 RepID=UPI0012DC2EEE|nr:hypothetical protein [Thioalkalivibrio sp. HK1]